MKAKQFIQGLNSLQAKQNSMKVEYSLISSKC